MEKLYLIRYYYIRGNEMGNKTVRLNFGNRPTWHELINAINRNDPGLDYALPSFVWYVGGNNF